MLQENQKFCLRCMEFCASLKVCFYCSRCLCEACLHEHSGEECLEGLRRILGSDEWNHGVDRRSGPSYGS